MALEHPVDDRGHVRHLEGRARGPTGTSAPSPEWSLIKSQAL
jgi:hypothetical protein